MIKNYSLKDGNSCFLGRYMDMQLELFLISLSLLGEKENYNRSPLWINRLKIRRRIMIPFRKNLILTFIVGVVFLFILTTNGYTRICANGATYGFEDGSGDSSTASKTQSLENSLEKYVIEGAGYYLNAYSDILAFLNRVEESDLKGMDYTEAQQILERALGNMNNAVKSYYYLIRRVELTPYNEKVISKLLNFDYDGFAEKWQLNSILFKRVEDYLSKGDIISVFKYIYMEFSEISRTLYFLKTELNLGRMPELSLLWKLNENCSQMLLFGQYVSRVFYAL